MDTDRGRLDLTTLDGAAEWHVDPMDDALRVSRLRRESPDPLPGPVPLEVGRRLLLAQLQFSDWVLRRVEKVDFQRDRAVTRQVSIQFLVREDAPVVVDDEGRRFWLVPLSLVHRRTVVNFALSDEQQRRIPLPGIRLQQRLDQSILLAAAAAEHPDLAGERSLRDFVRDVVAGDLPTVVRRMQEWRGERP